MSLKAKLGDTWKEAKSLHVKVNGEWKDISKLYSRTNGEWRVIYTSSGAVIIEFLDYPYAIPVMKGWQYQPTTKVTRFEILSGAGTRQYTMGDADSMYERAIIRVYVVEGGTPQGEYTGATSQGAGSESEPYSSIRLEYTGYEAFQQYVYLQSGGTVTFIDHADEPQLSVTTVSGTVTVSDVVENGYIGGKDWTTVEDAPILPYDFSNISVSWDLTYDGSAQYLNGTVYLNGASIIDDSNVGSIEYELTYTGPNSLSGSTTTGTRDYTMNKTEFQAVINGGSFDSNGFGGYKSLASATISSMVVYDTEGNVIQTLADIQKFPEITGKVGDWDFSSLYWYNEAANGGWWQIILPSGSTPIIDKVVFTNESGTSVEITGVFVNQNLAYPINGTGLDLGLITDTITPVLGGMCTLDFYAGDVYVGSFTGGPFGMIGNVGYVDGKFTNPPFTGYVKVKGELSLSEYYNETGRGDITQIGLRTDGTVLSTARSGSCSFVNGGRGYVCGGYVNINNSPSPLGNVDIYTMTGRPASGTSLSISRWASASFVNGDYGYVCGGMTASSTASTVVDRYGISGLLSTGISLSNARGYCTGFTHGGYGYVVGGGSSNSTSFNYVERYNKSGVKNTGTALKYAVSHPTSFVLGDYAYVCGGYSSSSRTGSNYVQTYDASGNMSYGAISLSGTCSNPTSFVIGDNGYVVFAGTSTAVDVISSQGILTTGTALSVERSTICTSFALDGYGFVCGGLGLDTVEVYDKSGVRTTGNSLSIPRSEATSFVCGDYGFVCGGHIYSYTTSSKSDVVDLYHHEYETTYLANIPVTEGSTYELATTVTSTGDWDMSNATGVATMGNACTVSGITGSTPPASNIVITVNGTDYEDTVSDNNPNSKYVFPGFPLAGYDADSITLYDASGNIIASTVPFEHNASGTASISEVLTFDSKVSGTINYVAGDLTPSVQITVTDDSGNVIEGAEITIEEYNDWDLSKVELYPNGALRNVTGSVPPIDTLRFTGSSSGVQTLDVVGKDITGLISFIGTSGVFGTTLTFTRGESMSIELICNGTTVASNTITVMTFNWEHSGGGNN